MTQFTSRRSIRRYTQQPIDEALLNRLLSDAERTQTMGNLQLYSVVVTRSDEMKARLAPAHFSQPMVTGAPVVLTFCADYRRTTLWAEQRQGHPGYDNLLSFINAATDALLYCQTFCNMAEAEGLGLCFLGTTVYCPEAIIDTLQLPPLVFPVATITLGWPDEHPAQTDRLPLSAMYTKRPTPTIHPSASTPPMPRRKPPRRTATSWKSTTCRPSPRYSPTSATHARTMRPSLPRSSRRCADRDFSTTANTLVYAKMKDK